MKEWKIGITDNRPGTWKRAEPLWQDETIVATSQDSFLEVMTKLCETAISFRREYPGDSHVQAHLWNLKIQSYEETINPEDPMARMEERLMGGDDSDDEEDDSDDEDEGRYRGKIVIKCPQEEEFPDFDDGSDSEQKFSASTKLSEELLPVDTIIEVTYDYGSTTTLYLKVLSVKSSTVRKLLEYFSLEANGDELLKKLETVPAFKLPEEEQIDHFYPNVSKAFLGYYVPLFKESSDDGEDNDDEDNYSEDEMSSDPEPKKVIASATLGLSSRVSREEDTTFCTMEGRDSSSDLLFCPGIMDPDEFFQAAEKAWEPSDRKEDPHNLGRFRYDYIMRWVIAADNEEAYQVVSKMAEDESGYGPKMVISRLSSDRKVSAFSFEKTFPKTHAMLTCGKFRWFRYNKETLRVLVGRGVGNDHRGFEARQIIATYKHQFDSLHELLCAVEASWIWNGTDMTADTFIPEFDTDLGPSRPAPKVAKVIMSEKDSVIISSCQTTKKLVTALAISEDPGGKTVLYSGHDDGTLVKWSLDDNEELWSNQVFQDRTDKNERYRFDDHVYVQSTPGVTGIVVRPNPKKEGQHLIYTWSDSDIYSSNPSILHVLSGEDGKRIKKYSCDVGDDDNGDKANPSISTVVFCPLLVEGELVDSILVGLHCLCSTLKYDECYTDFDLRASQRHSEGNILPFYEKSEKNGDRMETWRGHQGFIVAMAVVETKFLFSYSIQDGTGFPDSMILWSLNEPGVPLFRRDFWDPSIHSYQRIKTRLDGVCGISVCGKELLLNDEYGKRVVVVTVDETNGDKAKLRLHGYASMEECNMDDMSGCYHGRMAMSKSYAATSTEWDNTIWLFKIQGNATHPKLDCREGNKQKFERSYDDDETRDMCMGREIASGRVEIPAWGGNTPLARKKQKTNSSPFMMSSYSLGSDSSSENDGFGQGGPVMIALRGKWLVTGFSNGTISRTVLPDTFESDIPDCVSSKHQVCCSFLPSDEWSRPFLDFDEDGLEDEDGPNNRCVLS
jgi:hypothetical protein